MLTKSDLSQIEKIVEPIKKDVKVIKSDLKRVKKTVDVMAKVFDKEDVLLRKKVKRIEEHLGLSAPQ